MPHNLKKIRYYIDTRDNSKKYVIRVEQIIILAETLKSWTIKFYVKDYGEEIFTIPKSQCKYYKDRNIMEIPLWLYHRNTKLKPKQGNYNRYVYQECIQCYNNYYETLKEI